MPGLDRIRRRVEAVAERLDEFLELLDLQRVGILVDPVKGRHAVVVQVLRHGFVRRKHELFDDLVRDVPLGGDDVLDHPLIVQDDFRLLEVEVDRAAPVPAIVENLEELPHHLEQRDAFLVSGDDVRHPDRSGSR